MSPRSSRTAVTTVALAFGAVLALPAIVGVGTDNQLVAAPSSIALSPVGTYSTGLGVESGESAAVSKGRLYVTNSAGNSLDVVDVSNPAAPNRLRRIDLSPWGGGPTSVDADGKLVAVAVSANSETAPGKVVFFNRAGDFIEAVAVGSLPDMLTFTDEGDTLLVANEGQPSSYGQPTSVDPEGSISIIETKRVGKSGATAVATAHFRDFNVGGPRHAELPAGIRLNGPGATVAQDVEPEFITVDKGGKTAHVTLQEANAIAVVDIRSARITRIVALGTKDHSLPMNGLDPSDRDGAANGPLVKIGNWPIKGLHMPDAVASFKIDGDSYLITANEGDARGYTGFSDEARLGTLTLDPAVFPNAATLKLNANLGRLNVSTTDGKGPNGYREIFSFGARSSTIWNEKGGRVWDSGDLFERVTSTTPGALFNVSNDDNALDSRSDNKGPEPEGVAVGKVGGRTYAFVGLERVGGVMVLDVTKPSAPEFVQWANNRIYPRTPVGPDSGPEIVKFIPRGEEGRSPLVMVANEVSGTVTFYEVRS